MATCVLKQQGPRLILNDILYCVYDVSVGYLYVRLSLLSSSNCPMNLPLPSSLLTPSLPPPISPLPQAPQGLHGALPNRQHRTSQPPTRKANRRSHTRCSYNSRCNTQALNPHSISSARQHDLDEQAS